MSAAPDLSETIAGRYRAAVEAGDRAALSQLYHPEVFFDAHVPNWRFQVEGRHAVIEHTGGGLPGPGRFTAFDAEHVASGDLLVQFEWRQHADHGAAVVRQQHLLRTDEGRITEQTMFCAGIWDPELQARMASEAPLIRP